MAAQRGLQRLCLYSSSRVTYFLCSFSSSSATDSFDVLSRKANSLRGRLRYPDPESQLDDLRPLVVLVGWIKANLKNLDKYATLYNKLGAPTLSLTPSLFHFWNMSSHERYTKNVLKIVNTTYNGPILFHLFSGAPGVILPSFTQMTGELDNIKLKGIVFDSGPTLFGRESGIAAANANLAQGGMNRLSYYVVCAAGVTIDRLTGTKERQNLAEALVRPALSVPQLYLYSDADPVTPMRRVVDVMEQQKGLGRDVEGVVFKGASHVRLLVSDPDKYNKQISSFMDKINP